MVEFKPPNSPPNSGYEKKGPSGKDRNIQGEKINKGKKKNNRNRNLPVSTPSGMIKFKGKTKDIEGYVFDIAPKKSNMYLNIHKDICMFVGDRFGRYYQTVTVDMKPMFSQDPPEPAIMDNNAPSPNTETKMT